MTPFDQLHQRLATPASGRVVVKTLPVTGKRITIAGKVYVAGVDFFGFYTKQDAAKSLTWAINAEPEKQRFFGRQSPVKPVWAVQYESEIEVIATVAGAAGNSLGMSTPDTETFEVLSATLQGGIGLIAGSGSGFSVVSAPVQVLSGSFSIDPSSSELPLVTVDMAALGLTAHPASINARVSVPSVGAGAFGLALIQGWTATSFQVRLLGVPEEVGYKVDYLVVPAPAAVQFATGTAWLSGVFKVELTPDLPLVTVDMTYLGLTAPPISINARVVVPNSASDVFDLALIQGWTATSFRVRLLGVPEVVGYLIDYTVVPVPTRIVSGSYPIDPEALGLPLVTVDMSSLSLGSAPAAINARVVVPDSASNVFDLALIQGWTATSFQVRLLGVPEEVGYRIDYVVVPI